MNMPSPRTRFQQLKLRRKELRKCSNPTRYVWRDRVWFPKFEYYIDLYRQFDDWELEMFERDLKLTVRSGESDQKGLNGFNNILLTVVGAIIALIIKSSNPSNIVLSIGGLIVFIVFLLVSVYHIYAMLIGNMSDRAASKIEAIGLIKESRKQEPHNVVLKEQNEVSQDEESAPPQVQ